MNHYPRLEKYLTQLPASPGVYLMCGTEGQILYVGKAKSLKNRVKIGRASCRETV
jgi:excinuclease ABC subunit C